MERLFTKTKVLIYIILALFLINVATIGTILWHKKGNRTEWRENYGKDKGKMSHKGDFIQKQLNLTDDQKISYEKYHKAFWEKTKLLLDSMQLNRQKFAEGLSANQPDTLELMRINNNMGALHIELKKNSLDFYFQLKKICTPAQQDTLKNIFKRMLEFEGGRGFHSKYDKGKDETHSANRNEQKCN